VLPKTCSSRDTARHLTRNRTTEQAHKANPVVLLGPSTHSTALLRLRAAACLPTHVLRAYSWTFAKLHSSPVLSATRSAALIRRLCRSLSAFATVELHDNLRAKNDSQSGKGEQHPCSAQARPGLLAWVLLKAAEELQLGVGFLQRGVGFLDRNSGNACHRSLYFRRGSWFPDVGFPKQGGWVLENQPPVNECQSISLRGVFSVRCRSVDLVLDRTGLGHITRHTASGLRHHTQGRD
jgi:hypothetical protein